jgi:hypothetical protein
VVIVADDMLGICMSKERPRLVVQEPDVMVKEPRLKYCHVEIVEELCLNIKSLSARLLPPSKVPNAPQRWQPELEEFAVNFLLAAHACVLTI